MLIITKMNSKCDEQLVDTDSKNKSENITKKINNIDKNIKFLQLNLMKLQKLKH